MPWVAGCSRPIAVEIHAVSISQLRGQVCGATAALFRSACARAYSTYSTANCSLRSRQILTARFYNLSLCIARPLLSLSHWTLIVTRSTYRSWVFLIHGTVGYLKPSNYLLETAACGV